ncbi:predicted protein [Histoplasma capsulatum H143]|uniref:Uncharacterized protein n=1 Tax=Ajellomyces capsulatus (strain H143) TaxID=544712 RepID=C6HP45_AJECH|nr:predicted protein [Histoplasma capsulatum H143]
MHPITNTLSTRAGLDAFETTYAHLPITSGAYFAPGKSGAGKRANFGSATAIAMVDHNAIGIRRADVSGVGLSVALRKGAVGECGFSGVVAALKYVPGRYSHSMAEGREEQEER